MSVASDSADSKEGRGIFSGHLAGGVAYVTMSLTWVLKYHFRRSFCQRDESERRGLSGHYIWKMFRLIPWEGCIFFFSGLVGVIGGILTPFFRFRMIGDDDKFSLDSLRGWQHIVMYSNIALFGVVMLLADTKFNKITFYLKPLGSAIFAITGTVFALHGSMENAVDSQIHKVLVLCSYGIAVSFALETAYPVQKLFFMTRVFFTFLQGSWLIEAAYILEPPNGKLWDGYDKLNVMFISTTFLIHVLVDFWFALLIFCCASHCSRQIAKYQEKDNFHLNECELRLLEEGNTL
ncbi:Transmembrane protein 45B [Holothuria leucospilota]|uniref:Transmembrane protein 45B n=1 Tax=Holothuria leucospilota TaxID=206669 RepID=A0A9Q1BBM1_HOLLE|nr:Transmembrane protein 45B [Holothuria leucospilota]